MELMLIRFERSGRIRSPNEAFGLMPHRDFRCTQEMYIRRKQSTSSVFGLSINQKYMIYPLSLVNIADRVARRLAPDHLSQVNILHTPLPVQLGYNRP